MAEKLHYTDFAQKIKSKYPAYQDTDDKELAERIVEKYPTYSERVTFDEPQSGAQAGAQPTFSVTGGAQTPDISSQLQTRTQTSTQAVSDTPGTGFIEGLAGDATAADIPFVGGVKETVDLTKLYQTAQKLKQGGREAVTDEEFEQLRTYYADQQERQEKFEEDFGYAVGSVMRQSLSFGVEIAGGVAAAGATLGAGSGVLAGTLAKRSAFKAAQETLKKALRDRSVREVLNREVAKSGLRATGRGLTVAGVSGSTRVPADVARRTIGDPILDENENLVSVTDGQDIDEAVVNATSAHLVEVGSEFTGGVFTAMARPVKRLVVKSGALKALLGKNPDMTPSQGRQLIERLGWNGVLGEFGEERIGDVAHGALEAVGLGDQPFEFPSYRDMAVEIAGFSALGVGASAMQQGFEAAGLEPTRQSDVEETEGTAAEESESFRQSVEREAQQVRERLDAGASVEQVALEFSQQIGSTREARAFVASVAARDAVEVAQRSETTPETREESQAQETERRDVVADARERLQDIEAEAERLTETPSQIQERFEQAEQSRQQDTESIQQNIDRLREDIQQAPNRSQQKKDLKQQLAEEQRRLRGVESEQENALLREVDTNRATIAEAVQQRREFDDATQQAVVNEVSDRVTDSDYVQRNPDTTLSDVIDEVITETETRAQGTRLSELPEQEQRKAYDVATGTGQFEGSFESFVEQRGEETFDTDTLEPAEATTERAEQRKETPKKTARKKKTTRKAAKKKTAKKKTAAKQPTRENGEATTVPREGFEPPTSSFSARRSALELSRPEESVVETTDVSSAESVAFDEQTREDSEATREETEGQTTPQEADKQLREFFEQRRSDNAKLAVSRVKRVSEEHFGALEDTGVPAANKTAVPVQPIETVDNELATFVANVEDIKAGRVTDNRADHKVVGQIGNYVSREELRGVPITLNREVVANNIEKHGTMPAENLVLTINRPDEVIVSQAQDGRDKINFLKSTPDNRVVLVGANRVDGFAVVTTHETRQNPASLRKRGDVIFSRGETADLPSSPPDEAVDSRAVVELSVVTGDTRSVAETTDVSSAESVAFDEQTREDSQQHENLLLAEDIANTRKPDVRQRLADIRTQTGSAFVYDPTEQVLNKLTTSTTGITPGQFVVTSKGVSDRGKDLLALESEGVFTDAYILINKKEAADKAYADLYKKHAFLRNAERGERVAWEHIVPEDFSGWHRASVQGYAYNQDTFPAAVLSNGGARTFVDVNKYAYMRKLLPNADIFMRDVGDPVMFFEGTEMVGMLMPLHAGERMYGEPPFDTGAAGDVRFRIRDEMTPNVTSRVLDMLGDKKTTSKEEVRNFLKRPAVRQAEKDIISELLEGENKRIDVAEFSDKVRAQLVPLTPRLDIEPIYETTTLPEHRRGMVENYEEVIYESPFQNAGAQVHFHSAFSELGVTGYFAHVRSEDVPSETRGMPTDLSGNPLGREDVSIGDRITYQGDLVEVTAKENSFVTVAEVGKPDNTKTFNFFDIDKQRERARERIRRVIELQSDLFQHSRLDETAEEMEGAFSRFDESPAERLLEEEVTYQGKTYVVSAWDERRKTFDLEDAEGSVVEDVPIEEFREVIFPTQRIRPYRNTWWQRVVREEVRRAAKDGKTLLQIPTGETAVEVENIGGQTRPWARLSEQGDIETLTVGNMRVGDAIAETDETNDVQPVADGVFPEWRAWYIVDVLGEGRFKAVQEVTLNNDSDVMTRAVEGGLIEEMSIEAVEKAGGWSEIIKKDANIVRDDVIAEQFDVSGEADTSNPIYRFYEKEVGKFLKNQYSAERITDENGVSWWQFTVPEEAASQPVMAFRERTENNPTQGERRLTFLRDMKTRLNLDFDVLLADRIIAGVRANPLTKQRSLMEADGAFYDNTIVLARDAVENTDRHEAIHLTMANMDSIPVFQRNGVTRERVLRAKAQEMGRDYDTATSVQKRDLEEQLARDFENYRKGTHKPRGIIRKFFVLLQRALKKLAKAFGANNGEVIKTYYDILEEGQATEKEMFRLENRGLIASFLDGGVLDARRMDSAERLRENQEPIGDRGAEGMVARERFDIPNLEKISFGGSDRDVYRLEEGKVLKVAKTARGLRQNDSSEDYLAEDAGLIPQTLESGKNYVVKEEVKKPDKNTKDMVEKLSELSMPLIQAAQRGERGFVEQQKAFDIMNEHGFNGDMLMNYEPLWGDTMVLRNWGTKDGKPILLDEGTLNGRLIVDAARDASTRGRRNLDDPDFREVYDRSRDAKRLFQDPDAKTMYSIRDENDPNLRRSKQKYNAALNEETKVQSELERLRAQLESADVANNEDALRDYLSLETQAAQNAVRMEETRSLIDTAKERRNQRDVVREIDRRIQLARKRGRQITTESGKFELRPMTRRQVTRRALQEQNTRIENVQTMLVEQGGIVEENADIFLHKTLYPRRLGARLRVFKDTIAEPLVQRVVEDGLTVQELDEYAHALHAPRRNQVTKERGFEGDNGSGITDQEAQETIDRFEREGKVETLNKHREALRRIQELILAIEVEYGLRSQEEVDALRETYGNDYVPLGREMDTASETGIGSGSTRRLDVRGKESKRAKGSERTVLPITAQVFAKYEKTLKRAEQNRVLESMVNLIESNNQNGAMDNLFKVTKQQYRPRYDKDGELQYLDPVMMSQPNVIGGKLGGKQVYIEVLDQDLARALTGANLYNGFAPSRAVLTIMAASITQYSPSFVLRNFQRDFFEGMINFEEIKERDLTQEQRQGVSREVAARVPSIVRNVYRYERGKSTKDKQLVERFKTAGGEVGYFWSQDITDVTLNIEKLEKQYQNKGFEKVKKPVRAAADWVESANKAVELGIRMSIFEKLTERGVTDRKAAQIAGDITVDFNKVGEWGGLLKSLYLFINPAIQGTYRVYSAATRSRNVRIAVGAMVMGGFLNGLLSSMLGGDGDDDIPAYEKNTRIVFATPGGNQVTVFFLPYGYNAPWAAGRYIWEVIDGRRTPTEAAVASTLAAIDSFNPFGGSRFSLTETVPSAAKPLFEMADNTGWHGGEIHPEQPPYQAAVPNHTLYWDNVSNFSKLIAEWMNKLTGGDAQRSGLADVSPENIDYAIAQYTGGVGQFAQNIIETGTAFLTEAEMKRDHIPIVRDYYTAIDTVRAKQNVIYPTLEDSRRKSFSEQQQQRFYNAIDQLEQMGEMESDYAKELRTRFRENQHFVETGEDIITTEVRSGLERMSDGEPYPQVSTDVARSVYGTDYTSRELTQVRKRLRLHQTFGFDDDAVNALTDMTANATKAEYLQEMKNSMGEEQFREFIRKGRTKYTTGSGGSSRVLISDDLLQKFRELEN